MNQTNMYNEKYKIEEEERIWRCVIGKGMKKKQKYEIEEHERIRMEEGGVAWLAEQ